MFKKMIPMFLVLAVAATVTAQTVFDPQTQPATAVGGVPAGADGQQLDQAIATCLILGNHEEVALAEFAQGRGESDEVKQFAEMMIKDHRAAIEKLSRLVPQAATVSLQGGRGAGARRDGADRTGAGATAGQPGAGAPRSGADPAAGQRGVGAADPAAIAGGAGGGIHSALTAMQVRTAQECLNLTQQELEEKQGAEFDLCYINQQVGAHIGMLAKLRGSRDFASPELQTFIQEAEQTVQQHLNRAKELAKKLDEQSREGSGGQAARQQSRR